MEKRTFGKGLKRLGLAGILGVSLMFGGIGALESYGQDANFMANRLEYEATWKGQSASDRRILRGGAYNYRQQANLDAEEDAKKRTRAINKQNDLLRKMAEQNQEKNTDYSYQKTESSGSEMTLEEARASINRHKREELIKARTDKGLSPDEFFTCRYYVDKNDDDLKDGGWFQKKTVRIVVDYPYEFEGVGITKTKVGEQVAFGAKFNREKGFTYSVTMLQDGKEFFSETKLMDQDDGITFSEFKEGISQPGEYTAEWRLNGLPEIVGINKITVEPEEVTRKGSMMTFK